MPLSHAAFRRLCHAREMLEGVAEQPLSIRQIARAAAMSPFHFIRQFEALFGVTPHQLRIQSRLYRAKLLLAEGHSVTDVSLEVGFESLGSFSDLFARRVGTPPSVYQRRARVMMQAPYAFPQDLFPGCLSLMGSLPASAFRNFQEASDSRSTLECLHANQADQHHGR